MAGRRSPMAPPHSPPGVGAGLTVDHLEEITRPTVEDFDLELAIEGSGDALRFEEALADRAIDKGFGLGARRAVDRSLVTGEDLLGVVATVQIIHTPTDTLLFRGPTRQVARVGDELRAERTTRLLVRRATSDGRDENDHMDERNNQPDNPHRITAPSTGAMARPMPGTGWPAAS